MSCIFNDTLLGGVKLIIPKVYYDSRGYFLEAMNRETVPGREMSWFFISSEEVASCVK
jgi:dTDP-4-dehydrorhamnose 3,5-epimerase-like enzyme